VFLSLRTTCIMLKWHKPWWHYSSLKHWCFPRSYVNNFYLEIILFELASCIDRVFLLVPLSHVTCWALGN
jgi:hypothetical protein